jgi:hypothetical protein
MAMLPYDFIDFHPSPTHWWSRVTLSLCYHIILWSGYLCKN